ncbi:hypothetical protein [[Kitasatospora] papulosa]|uniref:hypothetical protein n=1 Tax=[Kitasatospora] papulosa TaxID=1464011 RepID=UPI0036A2EDF2
MHRMTSTLDAPSAGLIDDMTRDDDARGPERDETDTAFRQLVAHLVADDRPSAGTVGVPGAGGFFSPEPLTQNTLQCDQCGGRFGFTPGGLWTCGACKAIGR